MSKTIQFKLTIVGETTFEDDESDIDTVIYCLEQDLQDAGWDVEVKQ